MGPTGGSHLFFLSFFFFSSLLLILFFLSLPSSFLLSFLALLPGAARRTSAARRGLAAGRRGRAGWQRAAGRSGTAPGTARGARPGWRRPGRLGELGRLGLVLADGGGWGDGVQLGSPAGLSGGEEEADGRATAWPGRPVMAPLSEKDGFIAVAAGE